MNPVFFIIIIIIGTMGMGMGMAMAMGKEEGGGLGVHSPTQSFLYLFFSLSPLMKSHRPSVGYIHPILSPLFSCPAAISESSLMSTMSWSPLSWCPIEVSTQDFFPVRMSKCFSASWYRRWFLFQFSYTYSGLLLAKMKMTFYGVVSLQVS